MGRGRDVGGWGSPLRVRLEHANALVRSLSLLFKHDMRAQLRADNGVLEVYDVCVLVYVYLRLTHVLKLSVPSLQAHAVPDSCAPHCSFSKALNLLFQLGLGHSLCRCHLSLARLST